MNWTKHPIHEAPTILGRDSEGRALARFSDGVRKMTPEQLLAFYKVREEQIANEREDPLRYGWEPGIWRKADGLRMEEESDIARGRSKLMHKALAQKVDSWLTPRLSAHSDILASDAKNPLP